jgi:pimeloyl-ACP methyl ester carboxylesterase
VGLSDPIAPSDPPTLEQLVEDAIAVMDAAGSSSAACFADGPCADAILMTATHPERIRRLVLVNFTARVMRAPDYPCGIPERLVTSFLEMVTRPDAVEQDVDDLALLNPSMAGDSAFRTWVVRAGRRGPALRLPGPCSG